MARARLLHPEFARHEGLAELGHTHRLLFALLPTIADREGLLEDRPRRIKAELFPYDSDELADVEHGLVELARVGCLTRTTIHGKPVIQIPGFLRWQRPHPNEAESKLASDPVEAKEIRRNKYSSCIYAIVGTTTGLIKIGTSANPWARLNELQIGCTEKLVLVGKCNGGSDIEAKIHKSLKKHRSHGEWFRSCVQVYDALDTVGIPTKDLRAGDVTPTLPVSVSISDPVPVSEKLTAAIAPAEIPLPEKPEKKKPEPTPEKEACRRVIRARFESEFLERSKGEEFRWLAAEHIGIERLAALDTEGKGTDPSKGLRALEEFIRRMAVKRYYAENFAPRIVAQEINNLRLPVKADPPKARAGPGAAGGAVPVATAEDFDRDEQEFQRRRTGQ